MTEPHDPQTPYRGPSPDATPSQTLGPPPVQPAYGPAPEREPHRPALDRFFGWFRRQGLRRLTGEKWLAGVCAGIARRLGVDPLVVRAGLIVLVLLGGIGITVYLVAWLLIPDEQDDILLEGALRHGDVVGVLLLALAAITLVGGPGLIFDDSGLWWLLWVGVPVGVVIWLVTRRKDGRAVPVQQSAEEAAAQARAWGEQVAPKAQAWGEQVGARTTEWGQQLGARLSSDTATAPTTEPTTDSSPATGQSTAKEHPMTPTTNAPTASPSTPATAYAAPPAYGPPPPPAAQDPRPPRPPKPPRPQRRRGLGFAGFVLAMGLAALAFGGAMILHDSQDWSSDATVVALSSALGALGLVVLLGGLMGRRAGFTGFIAVVVGLLTWLAAVTPNLHLADGAGDPTWRPVSTSVNEDYELGFGSATLDLESLPAASRGEIDAEVGFGELRIDVPQGVTVRIVGDVGGGDIEIRQDTDDSFGTTVSSRGGLDERIDRVFGTGQPTVTVDATVGFGQLVVIEH